MERFSFNPGEILFFKVNNPFARGLSEIYLEAYSKVQNQNLSIAPPIAKMIRNNPNGVIIPRMSNTNRFLKSGDNALSSLR